MLAPDALDTEYQKLPPEERDRIDRIAEDGSFEVLSRKEAGYFMRERTLLSNTQKAGKVIGVASPTFDWVQWGYLIASLSKARKAGEYRSTAWGDFDRSHWPSASIIGFLTLGQNAPFKNIESIPKSVLLHARCGFFTAISEETTQPSPRDIALALGVTFALREEHKLWQIHACDVSAEQFRELVAERNRKQGRDHWQERKAKRNAERSAKRVNELGGITLSERSLRAKITAEACGHIGISARTFRRRTPEERLEIIKQYQTDTTKWPHCCSDNLKVYKKRGVRDNKAATAVRPSASRTAPRPVSAPFAIETQSLELSPLSGLARIRVAEISGPHATHVSVGQRRSPSPSNAKSGVSQHLRSETHSFGLSENAKKDKGENNGSNTTIVSDIGRTAISSNANSAVTTPPECLSLSGIIPEPFVGLLSERADTASVSMERAHA